MNERFLLLALGLALAVVGCTSTGPTVPDELFMESQHAVASSGNPDRTLWGLWEIEIDPATNTATVTPLRFGSFHANVRQFLENGPCTDCVRVVPPILPTIYGVDVTIGLEHPFPGDGYYNGFDVRGIVMLDGTYSFPGLGYLTTRAATGEWALLNPDGFTPVFNALDYTLPGMLGYSRGKMVPPVWPDPTNTLNAFKAYYSDGQGEDEGGRRGFLAGDYVAQTYELQFVESELFRFWYAVDASWEPPPGDPPYNLESFPPEANCPEAYRFDFSVVAGDLYPDSGSVTVGLDAWDHQSWEAPYLLTVEAPECGDGFAIPSPPIYVDGDKAHWEMDVTNLSGGLDPDLGAELLVRCSNTHDDPLTGPIHGFGRFTMPVSTSAPTPEVYSIDPDEGNQGETIDTAAITGANFLTGCMARLEKQDETPIAGTDVLVIDSGSLTCVLDLTGAVMGYWDVVVENPGGATGSLEDGFRVLSPAGCNDALHSNNLGTGDFSGGTHMSALDACFIHDTSSSADGEFMGYISGYGGTVVLTYIVDTTTPQDGSGMGGGDWGNPHMLSWPTPDSIDISEELGRFFVVWNDTYMNVEEWTYDGVVLNTIDASSTGRVFCLDTDGYGGWWNGYFPEAGFAPGIKHFVPNASMSFDEVPGDHIMLEETWGTPQEMICLPDETLLVLSGMRRGRVRAYDISSSPPVYIDEITNIFSGDVDFGGFPDKPCDMVADMTDPDQAHCRIVVWGNLQSGGGELVKIDSDLNVLAGPVSVPRHYQSIDLNPDVGHVTLWPERGGSPGGYALVELPADW